MKTFILMHQSKKEKLVRAVMIEICHKLKAPQQMWIVGGESFLSFLTTAGAVITRVWKTYIYCIYIREANKETKLSHFTGVDPADTLLTLLDWLHSFESM